MKKRTLFFTVLFLAIVSTGLAQRTVDVDPFDKVIISPHIEVTFVQGSKESVTIENSQVDESKLNIEVEGKTLRVYLDGAKNIPKQKKVYVDGNKMKRSLYNGTQVTATITYTQVDEFSLRGEEQIVFQSKIEQEELRLKIYGESEVSFEALELEELRTTIYGESELVVKSGNVRKQKIVAYGESKVDMEEIKNSRTKLTAYGEAEFALNTSDEIKVTAYGEAVVGYKGTANVKKGITIGDVKIYSLD
ncbi:MAG: head GIN domain-containing protein [Bacteroidota bacterium]